MTTNNQSRSDKVEAKMSELKPKNARVQNHTHGGAAGGAVGGAVPWGDRF